jgi:hypothetical protein
VVGAVRLGGPTGPWLLRVRRVGDEFPVTLRAGDPQSENERRRFAVESAALQAANQFGVAAPRLSGCDLTGHDASQLTVLSTYLHGTNTIPTTASRQRLVALGRAVASLSSTTPNNDNLPARQRPLSDLEFGAERDLGSSTPLRRAGVIALLRGASTSHIDCWGIHLALGVATLRAVGSSGPVGGRHYPRSAGEFGAWFATDADCLDYLAWLRWPEGFVCPDCGHRVGWQMADGRFRCGACDGRTSVTAGTIFDKTRTALTVWFTACWLFATQKDGVSAQSVQRAWDIGSYQTAWAMLHRFRAVLVRPGRERLSGTVEVDETFIGARNQVCAVGERRVRSPWLAWPSRSPHRRVWAAVGWAFSTTRRRPRFIRSSVLTSSRAPR